MRDVHSYTQPKRRIRDSLEVLFGDPDMVLPLAKPQIRHQRSNKVSNPPSEQTCYAKTP